MVCFGEGAGANILTRFAVSPLCTTRQCRLQWRRGRGKKGAIPPILTCRKIFLSENVFLSKDTKFGAGSVEKLQLPASNLYEPTTPLVVYL